MVNNNPDLYFYTNNILESTNRTLNAHYIGLTKDFYTFSRSILELMDLFKTKDVYEDKYCSITRALAYYAHKNDNTDLITNQDLKNILKDYINYRKKNNLPLDNKLENNKEYDIIYKEKKLFSDNDLSDNYVNLSDLNNDSDNSIEISLKTKHNYTDSSDHDNNHNHHNTLNNKIKFENKSNNKFKNDYNKFHKKNNSHNTNHNCLKNFENLIIILFILN